VDAGWFLRFKTQELCDSAAPCNLAAFHNIGNQSAPLVPCNKDPSDPSDPNCAYCCNFTRAYNEPIGGAQPWGPGGHDSQKNRFGNNGLGDGQWFWDFRNADAQDYFAEKVCLQGMLDPHVDGTFPDDPGGYGQEHPAVQAMVQLTDAEIAALQLGAQQAWLKALALLTKHKKYIPQAYRSTPPFSASPAASCSSWMRSQCAVPANESTQVYDFAGHTGAGMAAQMAVATFLVSRGPYSYLGAPPSVGAGDWNDPIFRLHRLDTGKPKGGCTEATANVFTRVWSGGKATVDCNTATATLDFKMLKPEDLL